MKVFKLTVATITSVGLALGGMFTCVFFISTAFALEVSVNDSGLWKAISTILLLLMVGVTLKLIKWMIENIMWPLFDWATKDKHHQYKHYKYEREESDY
jgi:hypothetical protein